MRIAEALKKLKDLKEKAADLETRITRNTQFEKIKKSQEVPNTEDLIESYISVSKQLADLKSQVAKANAKHGLIDKIHRMEHLKSAVSKLYQLIYFIKRLDYDSSLIEVNTIVTYDVKKLTNRLTRMQDEIRKIDVYLLKANWRTDLE